MLNWLHFPKLPQVAQYVECYWFIEKLPESQGHQFPKLNPDPCAHFIISPDEQPYCYEMTPKPALGKGSHLLYPHQQTFELDHAKPFAHLGVKFHTGALYSLLSGGSNTQCDSVEQMSIQDLLDSASNKTTAQLIDTARTNSQACVVLLDKLLEPWVSQAEEDKHSEITRKALALLNSTPISELGNAVYCSQRTLERSFNRVTGLTLKQCHAMNKLEQMLEYLYRLDAKDIDWLDVAYRFGFSDQPHLIRHLKKQIGFTPNNYAKARELTIDVYGSVSTKSD